MRVLRLEITEVIEVESAVVAHPLIVSKRYHPAMKIPIGNIVACIFDDGDVWKENEGIFDELLVDEISSSEICSAFVI